jgi:hypothetical protein
MEDLRHVGETPHTRPAIRAWRPELDGDATAKSEAFLPPINGFAIFAPFLQPPECSLARAGTCVMFVWRFYLLVSIKIVEF